MNLKLHSPREHPVVLIWDKKMCFFLLFRALFR